MPQESATSRSHRTITASSANRKGSISAPNGNWMASVETFGDQVQLLMRPFPDVDVRRLPVDQTSGPGQTHSLFSPDGSELLYLVQGRGIFSVDITYEPDLAIGREPRLVLNGPYRYGANAAVGTGARAWDRHPDGRFLIIRADGDAPSDDATPNTQNQINVIANWFEELKVRAPAD